MANPYIIPKGKKKEFVELKKNSYQVEDYHVADVGHFKELYYNGEEIDDRYVNVTGDVMVEDNVAQRWLDFPLLKESLLGDTSKGVGIAFLEQASMRTFKIHGKVETGVEPSQRHLYLDDDDVDYLEIVNNQVAPRLIKINPSSDNIDLQISGDNEGNLFYVDASTDRIGIGTASPSTILDVAGTVTSTGTTVNGALRCDSITNDTGLASGTYTPSLTNVTNIDSSTAYDAQYIRVGNVVTVSGKMTVDFTAGSSTASEIGMSLPVASAFANDEQCAGTVASESVGNRSGVIKADTTNDRAKFLWAAGHSNSQDYYFTFTYSVV